MLNRCSEEESSREDGGRGHESREIRQVVVSSSGTDGAERWGVTHNTHHTHTHTHSEDKTSNTTTSAAGRGGKCSGGQMFWQVEGGGREQGDMRRQGTSHHQPVPGSDSPLLVYQRQRLSSWTNPTSSSTLSFFLNFFSFFKTLLYSSFPLSFQMRTHTHTKKPCDHKTFIYIYLSINTHTLTHTHSRTDTTGRHTLTR